MTDTAILSSRPKSDQESRLDALEKNVANLAEAVSELTGAVDAQQRSIDILASVPGDVARALHAMAEDQSKVNLTLTTKLDMHRGLITDVQETIENLREETAQLEDDDSSIDEDSAMFLEGICQALEANGIDYEAEDGVVFFDIESLDLSEEILNFFADDSEEAVEEESTAQTEPEYEYVAVSTDVVHILLPTPVFDEEVTMEDFDHDLQQIVYEAYGQGLISDDVSLALLSGISGELTYERAREMLPQDEVPGVAESLRQWWDGGEEAILSIPLERAQSGIAQAIATAYITATMYQIAVSMIEAFEA